MAAIITLTDSLSQDVAGSVRFLESALYYGTTVVEMLADADRWQREEGEFEIAADIRRAAFWRTMIASEYGV